MPSIIAPHPVNRGRMLTTACSSVLVMCILFTALYYLVHHWKEILHMHPNIMNAMPLFGIVTVGAILPLGVQLLYLKEFAHLNPLLPHQYIQLCKKVYTAFLQNDGKISEKEL